MKVCFMGRFGVVGNFFKFGSGAVDVYVCGVLAKGNCEFHLCVYFIFYIRRNKVSHFSKK